jgi:hypothetical protein
LAVTDALLRLGINYHGVEIQQSLVERVYELLPICLSEGFCQSIRAHCFLQSEVAAGQTGQASQMGTTAQLLAQVASQGANVGAWGTFHFNGEQRQRPIE